MPPIDRTGTGPIQQTREQQAADNANATGQLGNHTVRQGESDGTGATIRSVFSKLADYLRAGFEKFKSLFSRSVSAGQADTARVAATARQDEAGSIVGSMEEAPPREPISLKKSGFHSVNPAGLKRMFNDTNVTTDGITEQMSLDLERMDYNIDGEDMGQDKDKTLQALRELVTDDSGRVDKEMLKAISQVAHQGLMSDGESKIIYNDLLPNKGILPAGQTSGVRNITITRLANGDIKLDARVRNNLRNLVLEDGRTYLPVTDDSYYEHAQSVVIHADSVRAGKPDLSNFPLDYSYNLQEAEPPAEPETDAE